jgi:NADH dehydrogenase
VVIKGFPAWLMHRGYHVLAVPTWERKIRVLAIWLTAALFGRDIVSLASVQHPREAFMADGELAFPPRAPEPTWTTASKAASIRASAHSVDICSE